MNLARLLPLVAALAACAARDRLPLRNQHISLSQLGDDLFRLVTRFLGMAVLVLSAERHTSGWTSSLGVDQLGQLIRARPPGATNLGEGTAVNRFRLGASGAPNSVTVVSASTPRHRELARSIVSGLRAPPPGGFYDGLQSFRFH